MSVFIDGGEGTLWLGECQPRSQPFLVNSQTILTFLSPLAWLEPTTMNLESTAMQEITGEIATALLVNLLGFTQSPFNWYWHGSKGPDQVGRHGSAGVWGIFEAKGGSNPLGITQQWGQQMGQRWLEHHVEDIINKNSGANRDDLRSQFESSRSMLAMVVRLNLTPSKGEIQITYQKFNNEGRMHPWRNA